VTRVSSDVEGMEFAGLEPGAGLAPASREKRKPPKSQDCHELGGFPLGLALLPLTVGVPAARTALVS
jgi:hypothetical protein